MGAAGSEKAIVVELAMEDGGGGCEMVVAVVVEARASASLESLAEELRVMVDFVDMAVSRRLRCRLDAEGGLACGVRDRWAEVRLAWELAGEMDGTSPVFRRSSFCINCFVLTCLPRFNSTRLLEPLWLRLMLLARSLPAMTLAFGGGCSIHRFSAGSGEGRLTTGGWSSLTGGARAE